MKAKALISMGLLLALGCRGLDEPRRAMSHAEQVVLAKLSANHGPYYYDQVVDHFGGSSTSNRTFKQRYYVVDDHWAKPNGPFILYIGGESPLNAPKGVNGDEFEVLAKQNKAAVLSLEHRYFGKSLPFPDLSTEHLRYLDVEQELEDLAGFIRSMQAQVNAEHGLPSTHRNKVLIIGGSYAGMVASHARYVHPEVFDVAWSSSGVVDAVYNFTEFDLQVAVSVGQRCAEVLRRATEEVDALLITDNAYVKALFGASGMSDDDLMWMLSDAETLPPQYGKAESLCEPMVAAYDAGEDLAVAFARFCNDTFYPGYCAGAGPYLYSDELMRNTTATEEWSSQRAWWWCVCNQLSYAQSYPGELGIRSPRVSLDFHKRKCDAVYGVGVWPPKTKAFNEKYGAKNPKATNVVYINASQDPWQWAAVRRAISSDKPAYLMTGERVGHCRDLHVSPDDPVDVLRVRKAAEAFVAKFLQ